MSKRTLDRSSNDLDEEDLEETGSASFSGKRSSLLRFKKARCDEAYLDEATTSTDSTEQLMNKNNNATTFYHRKDALGNGGNASSSSSSSSSTSSSSLNAFQQPSRKKRVSFGAVSIYYFQRSQGFSCVPTSGGSTLGMARNHHFNRVLTLAEHLDEIRIKRELYVDEQQQQQKSAANAIQQPQTQYGVVNSGGDCNSNSNCEQYASSSANNELDEEEEFEFVEEEEQHNGESDNSQQLVHYDDDEPYEQQTTSCSNSANDATANSHHYWNQSEESGQFAMPDDYYLQPLDSRQRRSLLRAIGVQVDRDERAECQSIRISRQSCGCNCRGQCLPATCACAVEQIKCQVDRPTFPCSCTENTCMNPFGRVEFNAVRVRTHYLHTMMRIRLENKHQTVLPSPTHIKFGQQDGYVDQQQQQQQQQDCKDDLVNHNDNNGSNSSNIPPATLPASAAAYRRYTSATSTAATESSNGYYENQTFWSNHVGDSSPESGRNNGLVADSASYVSLDSVSSINHQNGMSSTNGNCVGEHYFDHNTHHVSADMLPYEEEVVDVVNGYHGNDVNDVGQSSVVLTKMRDRSASFSVKSRDHCNSQVQPSSSTYSLASLYSHQQNHRHYSNSRSHAFNEFLDPLYFPTFDLAAECSSGASKSEEENDASCSSSSYPSDESNSVDVDDDVIDKNGASGHVIGNESASTRRDSQVSSPSSYLPSSPAELSAVLKKSICETVLA